MNICDTSSTNVYLLVYLFMHGYRLTKATSMAIHAFIGISLDLYMLKIVTVLACKPFLWFLRLVIRLMIVSVWMTLRNYDVMVKGDVQLEHFVLLS